MDAAQYLRKSHMEEGMDTQGIGCNSIAARKGGGDQNLILDQTVFHVAGIDM